MKLIETEIKDCYVVDPFSAKDIRGKFVKTFHISSFKEHHLETDFKEEFYSVSKKNVVRGFHFQTPPEDHVKLVYCAKGEIIDVVLDIRKGSPTYGKHLCFEINDENNKMVYIGKGLAHAFISKTDDSIVMYKVSTMHAKENDKGILFSSVDAPWPMKPIMSERDKIFPMLEEFDSPFVYSE